MLPSSVTMNTDEMHRIPFARKLDQNRRASMDDATSSKTTFRYDDDEEDGKSNKQYNKVLL